MSRRIGFLCLAAVVSGGLFAWFSMASPLAAQVLPSQAPRVAPVQELSPPYTVQPSQAKTFPAPPAHRAEGIFDFHKPTSHEETIQKALVNPKGVDFEFIDTPLNDAMDFLADGHNITILIDENALQEETIAADEPIHLTLSGVKMQSALKILLEPLELTYVIEDEVLKITTLTVAEGKLSTRVYNTGYLKQIGVEPEALSQTLQAVVEPEQWRRIAAYGGLAQRTENQTVGSRDARDMVQVWDAKTGRQVSEVLFRNAQAGGNPAKATSKPAGQNSIEVLGDMLVVSAPQSVHEKIQGVLIQLDRRWESEHGKK